MPNIRNDKAFNAEIVPPNLQKLIADLREFFNLPGSHIGCKGDVSHRRGYHRSRHFLQSSIYATNRRYSVVEPANRGGHDDWLAAIDITLDAKRLIPMCQRLDRACRAGQMEKVIEWYGNLGNDNRVDGYDNIRNAVASSDPSHLWHAHISFARAKANDDHTDLFNVLTGQQQETFKLASVPMRKEDSDMDPTTAVPVPTNKPYPGYLGSRTSLPAGELWHAIYYRVTATDNTLKELTESINKLNVTLAKLVKP